MVKFMPAILLAQLLVSCHDAKANLGQIQGLVKDGKILRILGGVMAGKTANGKTRIATRPKREY